MKEILVYSIEADPSIRDILLAFLGDLPFDSFRETEGGLEAYLLQDIDLEELESRLEAIGEKFPFTWQRHELERKNWNAIWEASFQPIRVGHFCGVRVAFHYPFLDVTHEIVITPQMTFGTGHHETTYMMLEAMEGLKLEGAKVLDYGCGTGILAILAAQMGATMVDAVDIEEEAYQNALHNSQVNNVDSVQVIHGTLDAILDSGYRVILANINRNVILSSLPALYEKLTRPGILVISGFLKVERSELARAARRLGFRTERSKDRGEWACLTLALPPES